jgi:hypothetical protein
MTVTTTYVKDPDTTERFGVNWGQRLAADAATISTVAWSATPAGLTLSGALNTTTQASTLVAGGVLGTTYALTCRVTTSDGQTLDATVGIVIQPT